MEAPKTPAQWFSMVIGAILVGGGVVALLTGSNNFGTVSDGAGEEFILWQVSGWETILYMGMGALGIFMAARVDTARTFALLAGAVFAAMAGWGWIEGDNSVAQIFAVDTTDNITHAAIGGLGILTAMLPASLQRKAGVGEHRHGHHSPA